MADIRIDHGYVVTMDEGRHCLPDGSVVIEHDRIVAIGPTMEIAVRHPAQTVIDAHDMAVLPGLIDAHAHAGHGLVKSMGGTDNDAWYEACASIYLLNSDEAFWRAEAALAALERLKGGVTCGVSLLGGGNAVMRTDRPDYAAAHIDAVVSSGIRVVLAIGPTQPPHPRIYRQWRGDGSTDIEVDFDAQMRTCEAVIRRWHGEHGNRIRIAMLYPTIRPEHLAAASPAELDTLKEQNRAAHALGRGHGLLFTQDGHCGGTVAFAHRELGILGPASLLSHATDLTDEEIRICADTDTRIAHNPSAIGSIYGRCPAPELMAAGVTVAIGSDATAPDRSGDMFRHMAQCMHYHRRHFRDPSVLPPGKALEMVTIAGARAIGMEDEIGSLEPGKKADVILVDLAKPHLAPMNMPLFRIAYFANGADVDTVIVDGRILMRGRSVSSVSEAGVLADAEAATQTMLVRSGLAPMLDDHAGFFGLPSP